jgi:hypothetical protein
VGGEVEAAEKLGVSRTAIRHWVKTGEVPAKRLKSFLALLREVAPDIHPASLNSYVVFVSKEYEPAEARD